MTTLESRTTPPAATDACWLVDVRTPSEFSARAIPGSVNIPLGDLESAVGELRPKAAERPLLLVCRTGNRAAKAMQTLQSFGITNVRVLRGGLEAWQSQGQAVAQGGGGGMSLERQVRIAAGSIVVVGVMLSFLVSPHFVWLAGFVGAGLVFAGITDTCGMGMVLARMPWNRRRSGATCQR
jgi:rhodanese-related sulfurtransferase